MRPIAIGRKNWIHISSAQAGPKIAAILSIVESCRRLKLPVRDYLAMTFPVSPTYPFSDSQKSLPFYVLLRSAERYGPDSTALHHGHERY
jgi:hypothetical protein